MIDFYNLAVEKIKKTSNAEASNDPTKISWSRGLRNDFTKRKNHCFENKSVYESCYRPFTKEWSYFNRQLNDMIYQMPRFFPSAEHRSLVISINANWSGEGHIALISNNLPDLHYNGDAQCFPLYLYEADESEDGGLFKGRGSGLEKKDGITNAGLAHFKTAYPGEKIGKEDVFYYIYGLLHSEEYREKYADNLSKQLPRIPCVKTATNFWAFSKAGRALAELHVGYESVKPHDVTLDTTGRKLSDKEYYVTKMKFAKKGDKSTVIYNDYITLRDIPVEAYDYVVNGKPALEWVMERQSVKTDKDSGIINDANLYATETIGDAAYPLKLFLRVITVSLETLKIVRALPKLDIQEVKI
jgi:predicted helicase